MVAPRKLASGKWLARLYVGEGRYTSLGTFDTEEAAKEAQVLAKHGILPNAPEPEARPGLMKFDVFAETVLFARRHSLAHNSYVNYQSVLRKHIVPVLGHRRLSEITPAMVRKWWLGLPESPRRIVIYNVLRLVLAQAVQDGAIAKSPATIQGVSKVASGKRPAWSAADLQMLLTAADSDQWRALLWCMGAGGLRAGEALAMDAQDVDLAAGTITMRGHLVKGVGVVPGAKHHADQVRVISMPKKAVDALRAHLASSGRVGPEPLFQSGVGRLSYDMARIYFDGLRRSLALDDLRMHDLRHLALTLYAQSGATLQEIMTRGGHSSVEMAMGYQHTSQARDAQIVEAMEGLFG